MFAGRSKGTQAGPTQVGRGQPAQAETAATSILEELLSGHTSIAVL
eukprot:COSAG01_NODE_69881_length_260_cov_0.639752_1_plen_45_part_10